MAATKPRILCLHGKFQSGSSFRQKIGGARRKLERAYDLEFLDGPIMLEGGDAGEEKDGKGDVPRAWWIRDDDGKHVRLREALEYVRMKTQGQRYDALIGFSQGGTLATALALNGFPRGIKAVVTAGAPMINEAFMVASEMALDDGMDSSGGHSIRKLHIAGEKDEMVPVKSTQALCDAGGNGELLLHEKGHMFPTKAVSVNHIMSFLETTLSIASEP
eukprot:CAMPEP_0183307584 /NCGR_PEP_ID=MMETSP0160_2-20130417/18125_1 /TAXON_ID=2839 ORGANISM="Odontella Sinensis, Strain Grunow 1884" /NCGR_SAMPLE_ID=MMETSP0160_2 /ASSEMBLY_ACC=CAM_ASM_000250 /LENGTH=217 /DNA_ID=CAMNT_0025471195 /DNA_START=126 /DNA_END=779 /DNA_ORIENTATION=+